VIKPKAIAQRIVSWVLKKFFNPLYRRGIAGRLPLLLSIYNFLYRRLNILGLYEPGTVKLVKKLLKDGMTFLDLGAHRGYYTLLASKLVGEKGRVFAFEPAPENFALLKTNVKGRSNVTLVQKAVSNKSGTARFFLSAKNTANHSLYDTGDNRELVDVEVTSLDDFFKGKDSKIDFIKMDIEGAELTALEGMAELIKKNGNLKIVTELNPKALEASGCPPVDFLNRLVGYGFKLYLINDEREAIEPNTVDGIMGLFQDGTQRVSVNLFCGSGACPTVLQQTEQQHK
jgi:FkbM family methyltransferase